MTLNSDWGLIGASSAMAWKPNSNSTWELISWRYPQNIGKKRKITSSVIREMESEHPETYVNRDPTKEKGLIAPRTPCPVLYGIRGASPDSVLSAHEWLQSNSEVEKLAIMVKEEMEGAVALSVPLKVDWNYGKNWYEAH